MNIEKAIEIKTRTDDEFLKTDPDEIDEAERLSIEALKRIKSFRTNMGSQKFWQLPGETLE